MNLAEIASVLQNPWLMCPAFVAAAQPLAVEIRGTKLNLHLVKPPFVELKKVTQ